ncbi:MAG: HAD-IIA family hydrolase [Crenarchaeota archaeon]|nr:HAD-IIA family hydrolase [Thermoproteota archaeon]
MPGPVLGRYRLLLVDLDGVVWRGSRILVENVEWLRRARSLGAEVVFVTNNSTRSRRVYAERLTAVMGYPVEPRDVVTSGYAVARLVRERSGESRVIVLGEEGLVEELVLQGHLVLSIHDPIRCPVDYVVVGLDRGLSYQKLRAAHEAVKRCGARVAVSNEDNVIPLERGDAPGAGAVLAALLASTGARPELVAGKPEPYMYRLVLRERGVEPREALVIGDRCDTDIEAARRAGLDSVLVLTGVAGERGERCPATYTVASLPELDATRSPS